MKDFFDLHNFQLRINQKKSNKELYSMNVIAVNSGYDLKILEETKEKI